LFLDYRLSKKFEIAASREFGVLLATTERDKALLQSDLPGKEIVVIQNGVHESFLGYPPVPRDPHMMVFVGLFTFYPNAHAVRHFLDEIFPGIRRSIPDAKITIVGSHPPRDIVDRASDHVAVTGWVDDVRPYIASAGVFVIPLRIGSGIRGKALEAMAMKCPIVTTTLGCAGIDLQDGVSALFADRPEDFAAAVVRLMQNPAEGQQLAEQAYAVVARKHDWVAKGEELQQVYQRLLERTPCPASTEPGLNPESGS
jgi:glycosyltransferase involved in cell wall biosynthesis